MYSLVWFDGRRSGQIIGLRESILEVYAALKAQPYNSRFHVYDLNTGAEMSLASGLEQVIGFVVPNEVLPIEVADEDAMHW